MSATPQMISNVVSLSSTSITPLSPLMRERLQRAVSYQAAAAASTDGEAGDAAVSQAIAKLTSLSVPPEPESAPMDPPARLARRLTGQQLARWGLAALLALSLVGNAVHALAPSGAQRSGEAGSAAPLAGTVRTVALESADPSSAPAAIDASSCLRDSAQPASCEERDRLLLLAIRDYDAGRREESLQRFKRYAGEVCDRATLQTIAHLTRQLSRSREGIVRTP
jgi:hypothetical protein